MPAAKLSVFPPILLPNLNEEAIGLKSGKESKMPSKPVSGIVLGLPVRNLAVGAVVGFELSGDELELLEEDMALRADALRA